MAPDRPLPEFWYPLARILLVLKALLAATAPEAFASIAAHVHRELRYAGAFLRRYLLALARQLVLPPPRPRAAAPDGPAPPRERGRARSAPFSLAELPPARRPPGPGHAPYPDDYVNWAIALSRAETLLAALQRPLPLARRLARQLARGAAPVLRDLAVPAFVLRTLPPALDALLMRLDQIARPDAWAGLDPDSG
ncbi:MAG: hypothetical protein IPK75_01210 [Acidobacteria bacterium]|nr:hypothetical protein [Acidobacteriota bacterium]